MLYFLELITAERVESYVGLVLDITKDVSFIDAPMLDDVDERMAHDAINSVPSVYDKLVSHNVETADILMPLAYFRHATTASLPPLVKEKKVSIILDNCFILND